MSRIGFLPTDESIAEIMEVSKLPNIEIEGILITKLDNRNIFGYKIVEKVKSLFPELTYKTIISRSSHIQEAPMYGKSVLEFSHNSRGSKQYRELALEVLSKHEGEKNE